MRVFTFATAFLLAWPTFALAFDNIEADALYEGIIKDQIRKEFILGLKMLRDQANRLSMQVREKDIRALQEHMYDKALLTGGCADKAITADKRGSVRIAFSKLVSDCIVAHLKFMDLVERTPDLNIATDFLLPDFERRRQLDECKLTASRESDSPYDFLFDKDNVFASKPSTYRRNYIYLKECAEKGLGRR
jgi:hypothetical protein